MTTTTLTSTSTGNPLSQLHRARAPPATAARGAASHPHKLSRWLGRRIFNSGRRIDGRYARRWDSRVSPSVGDASDTTDDSGGVGDDESSSDSDSDDVHADDDDNEDYDNEEEQDVGDGDPREADGEEEFLVTRPVPGCAFGVTLRGTSSDGLAYAAVAAMDPLCHARWALRTVNDPLRFPEDVRRLYDETIAEGGGGGGAAPSAESFVAANMASVSLLRATVVCDVTLGRETGILSHLATKRQLQVEFRAATATLERFRHEFGGELARYASTSYYVRRALRTDRKTAPRLTMTAPDHGSLCWAWRCMHPCLKGSDASSASIASDAKRS